MVYLNSLLDKFGPKGLRIVALSVMETDDVERLYVKENKARYWIGCNMDLETLLRFIRPNEVAECPHGYLVDVEGKVVGDGEKVGEDLVAKALEDYFDPLLGRELHPSLLAACESYGKGEIGKAWEAATKAGEDEDGALVADAKYLRERCEAHAAFARRQAEKPLGAKDYPGAMELLEDIAKRYAGMEAADWAKEKEREVKSDPAARKELQAWKELEKIAEKERKAGIDPKKREAVRKAYKALIKKYPGTMAAVEAYKRTIG